MKKTKIVATVGPSSSSLEMIEEMNEKNINNAVLVCHGGVIMAVFAMLCNESNDIYHYHVDNGQGYKAHYNSDTKELIIIEKL